MTLLSSVILIVLVISFPVLVGDSILEETGLHQMGVELVTDVVVMFQDLIEIDILW